MYNPFSKLPLKWLLPLCLLALPITSHAQVSGNSALKGGQQGPVGLYYTDNTGATLNTQDKWGVPAVTTKGAFMCVLDGTNQPSNATGLLKPEDSAHTSGDNGVFSLGVANTGFTAFAANGDYTPIATNLAGAIYADINFSAQSSAGGANALLKLEDSANSDGQAGVASLLKRQDQLATGETNANGDYALPLVDTLNRIYVNPWGAAVTEHFSSCATATATTADVALKAAAGAGIRIYVTSIDCKNTSATVATSLDFKDATTVIAVGGIAQMATTSPGTYGQTFPTPLRGTANTALNFATNVSVSSVTCCAQGFTSPY